MTYCWREWHGGWVSRHRRRVDLAVGRMRIVRFSRIDSFVVPPQWSPFSARATWREVIEFVVEVCRQNVVSVSASAL